MSRSTTSSSSQTHTSQNSQTTSQQQSQSQSQSYTHNVLDPELLAQILGGLAPEMTDEEIAAFAENMLRPQLNAGLEAAQQQYEATALGHQQEIDNIAAQLAQAIDAQQGAYRQNMADVETAALQRGMGRSSYTIDLLAKQGDTLAKAIQQLTENAGRQQSQLQAQITQAAQHNAQTQGRLNTDYAQQLAAKIEELRHQRRQDWNSNYLTALSSAMGQQTTGTQTGTQTGTSTTTSTTDSSTNSQSTTNSTGGGGGGGGGGLSTSSSTHHTNSYPTTPQSSAPVQESVVGDANPGAPAGGGGGSTIYPVAMGENGPVGGNSYTPHPWDKKE